MCIGIVIKQIVLFILEIVPEAAMEMLNHIEMTWFKFLHLFESWVSWEEETLKSVCGKKSFGTIHLRRQQFFHDFLPLPLCHRNFFTTIRLQIWPIFDPSPPKKCQCLKWMFPLTSTGLYSP